MRHYYYRRKSRVVLYLVISRLAPHTTHVAHQTRPKPCGGSTSASLDCQAINTMTRIAKRYTHYRLAIEHVLFREKENPMEEEEMHWKIDIHCSSGYGRLLDGNSRPKEDVYNGRESQGRSGRWRVLTV